jgi:hypothetical protein
MSRCEHGRTLDARSAQLRTAGQKEVLYRARRSTMRPLWIPIWRSKPGKFAAGQDAAWLYRPGEDGVDRS